MRRSTPLQPRLTALNGVDLFTTGYYGVEWGINSERS